jgi:flavin-dependent dehydrogenase
MSSSTDFDVGVIGGGPAGASLGAYLAKAGLRCVIYERESFPRPHVGESLVPSSTRVFREIGFLDQMEKHQFPRKYGAVWTSAQSAHKYHHTWDGLDIGGAEIDFAERDQPGVPQPYTYHVDRGLFDKLLLENAGRLGATVYQRTSVRRVDFTQGAPVVHVSGPEGECATRVDLVVDASGRHTVLAGQLGLKIRDTVFDQFAVHTWFDGYDRLSALSNPRYMDYIYVHFLPLSNSWVWQIPITDTITSIGVVTQKKNFAASKTELEPFFWRSVASRPELHHGLKRATQMRPLKAEGDYSYAAKQIVGDRFLLIGDAGRFVDPIFSTGVSIALNSARFASADIVKAFSAGDFRRDRFLKFETTIRRGTTNWYEFISLYYRLNVLFTMFVSNPKYRLDVLKLLQGDVYDEEPPEVLAKMRAIVTEVEDDKEHPWHDLLGTLTANAFRPAF